MNVQTDWLSVAEIPGSLVSEPKHRDSRSKTRLGLGIGLEISKTLEPESDPESNFSLFWNRNRYQNRILRSEVPESEPELYFRKGWNRNRNRNRNLVSVEFYFNCNPYFALKEPFLTN